MVKAKKKFPTREAISKEYYKLAKTHRGNKILPNLENLMEAYMYANVAAGTCDHKDNPEVVALRDELLRKLNRHSVEAVWKSQRMAGVEWRKLGLEDND